MTRVDSLTDRMDALAGALRDAGVDPERVASILGTAATATMNALLLDVVVEENRRPAQHADPPAAVEIVAVPLRAAA